MASFPSVHLEGGLLGPDVLDRLIASELPGQRPVDFGLDARRNLTDEIATAFADARALWGVFQHRLSRVVDDPGTTVTRDTWVIPFLGLLGYEPRYNQRAYEVDGMTFAVSHRATSADDSPPIHIVGAGQDLGRLAPSGRPRLAPHSLLQEYLNRTEHAWGLVTNGLTLRVLRNSTFVRRQAYVEFDLAAILDEQRFQDFVALYRLLHRTRLPRGLADAAECLLEGYYAYSVEQGDRVRDHLRDGVEQCILRLANGFLAHPANAELRRQVADGSLDALGLYRELLRLIYRFLFLLVSEDRNLISPNAVYRAHYGMDHLRQLLDHRAAYTEHDDLWRELQLLWYVFQREELAAVLDLAPLNGELFSPLTLDSCALRNRDLLEAFWYLAWYRDTPSTLPRLVNYAALDVEELGSVYESLLELHPALDVQSTPPRFDLVASNEERRATGSHYTPPELVAPLVDHALEPVLTERLRGVTTSRQKRQAILALKVGDLACGSGHFLLAAARRLGKELARVDTGEQEPAPERVREAIREVITHCIYGVDKNPLAVELCRVALWLESHDKGKPLTFLDHRIRCGDSLVGVFNLKVLADGIPNEAYQPVAGDDRAAAREANRRNARHRAESLSSFQAALPLAAFAAQLRELGERPEERLEQVRQKASDFARLQEREDYRRIAFACDLWAAAFFQPFPAPQVPGGAISTELLRRALTQPDALPASARGLVERLAEERRFFHWPLAFPDVFEAGGFDVILGNPPFMGGLKISTNFGDKYRGYLGSQFAPFPGTADLCAAFFRRAFLTLSGQGRFGLIATNTLSQGDTREAGLAEIKREQGVIVFARRYVKWPGRATVEVNLAAISKRAIRENASLDDEGVAEISSRLDGEPESEPVALRENQKKCFIGYYVRGIGFVLAPNEAQRLIEDEPRNSECLKPYLTGEDINHHIEQKPTRYVVYFKDRSLAEAQRFPTLLRICEERVKPERMKLPPTSSDYRKLRDRWWLFARIAVDMQEATAPLGRMLARSRVSEFHMLVHVPTTVIASEQVVIFAFDDFFHFALLQSAIHELWVRRNASTMRTDVRYTPSDCFETFAFPKAPASELRGKAARAGAEYDAHRAHIMRARELGLTKTYNLFHDPDCMDSDINRLRELHGVIDRAVLTCYGWTDLNPEHGFRANERGQTRYTISPACRREILRRLLALNLEIAAREAGEGQTA